MTDRLSLPLKISSAMYALRDYGSYTSVIGAPAFIQRFVAVSDLDETTYDAVTWVGDLDTRIDAAYALAIVPRTWNRKKSRPGSLIACDDPAAVYAELVRMVYGEDYVFHT